MSWSELEAALSGRAGLEPDGLGAEADGGDTPAWSRKREPYRAADSARARRGPACRTPSCTATPTSASSTAPATRRSWPRRRPGWAWPRSRSPTTTASTAWSGSPRPPRELGLPHGVRRRAVARAARAAERRSRPGGQPPARARPRPGGLRAGCAARSARPSSPAARRAARSTTSRRSPPTRPGTWLVLTGCRKGAVPQRAGTAGGRTRRPPRAGRAGRAVRPGQRGGRADRPRRYPRTATATTPSPRSPPTPGCRRWPPGNVHYAAPGPAPAGHRARRGAGPAQPRRDRRLAARRRHRAPALRRGDGGPVRARYPGAVAARPPSSARSCAFDLRPGRAEAAAFADPGRAHRDELAARADPARGAASGTAADAERTRGRTSRSSTSWTMIEELELPRLLPGRVRHRRRSAGAATSSARAGARRRTPRSATRCGITNVDAVTHGLLFERFLAPERDGPPDIDVDIESDRREEVIQHVYSRYGRQHAAPGRQRHLLPAAVGGARHGQGARLLARPAGRVEQADRPLGAAGRHARRRDIPAQVRRATPTSCMTLPAAPRASTPAAW